MAISMTSSGIVYTGTPSPAQAAGSGVSYTLDDYEVGTYTGAFGGVTSSNTGTAYYTKIGQRVFCNWYSSSVTIEGASGSATVLGHPFTAGGGNNYSVFSYCHGNAVDGNSIVFEYKATIDGKDFTGGEGKNVQLILGKDLFIKGFDKQLVGVIKNDEKSVEVVLPENYPQKEFANKKANFVCKILAVKKP